MSKSEVEAFPERMLVRAHTAPTKMERFRAYSHALEAVDDPRCDRPIPRFLLDLPWADNDDEVSDRIIAQMLAAENPYEVSGESATVSGKDLIGKRVVVQNLRVRPSNKQGGWGAYLVVEATLEDRDDEAVIVTVGAKQVVSLLAYAWCQGDLPLAGTFSVVTETGNGNEVLGFIVESAL